MSFRLPGPGEYLLLEGDNLETLADVPDAIIGACVCDPPYGLEFLGAEWDRLTGAGIEPTALSAGGYGTGSGAHANAYAAARVRYGTPGREMQAWHERWAREVLRLLLPGAYFLAFGGSRTSHRLACGIEDAGAELRDTLAWYYFSGFPKGLDLSQAIDRAAGAERQVVGKRRIGGGLPQLSPRKSAGVQPNSTGTACYRREGAENLTAPATDAAKQWDGWNTALKPAYEPVVCARKPLIGTVVENVQAHGVGGLNIDACRISRVAGDTAGWAETGADGSVRGDGKTHGCGFRTGSARSAEEVQERLSRGRWPANLLLSHSEDCECVGLTEVEGPTEALGTLSAALGERMSQAALDEISRETVEVWECVPGCPVRLMNEQTGELRSGKGTVVRRQSTKGYSGSWSGTEEPWETYGDAGGGARFFYAAKPAPGERHAGCDRLFWALDEGRPSGVRAITEEEWTDLWEREQAHLRATGERIALQARGNIHPTLKPVAILEWLLKLVVPPGKVVVDPFCGSGSLVVAALNLGIPVIACERDPDYCAITRARAEYTVQCRRSGRAPGRAKVSTLKAPAPRSQGRLELF